jgi:pilus assembly protein CpaB
MRRARPRSSRILLALSIALATLATVALRGYLSRLEARAGVGGEALPVVVAGVDLERGAVVGPSMVEARSVPGRYRPPGALTRPEQVVGRVLAADVVAGEALTAARLAPPGGPVAALIPQGLRAFPVPAGIPPGSLAAGDRVDVLATYLTGQPYSETVVTGAEVLRVIDHGAFADQGPGATVLLLVGPEAAERLAHATAFAEISLAVAPAEGAP